MSEKVKQLFTPFVKVDEAKRQVWGIVTAERPDKVDEVCDYVKSKPYFQSVISEISKATDGANFFPLREMHEPSAVGKCVGYEFRDADKEIYMGFEVVDDVAWKKVQKGVYTGFSQGGFIVGDMTPDPVFKGCMRYVAKPSEVSLVDNPCLADAHFAYVKADGSVEIRKFVKTVAAEEEPNRLKALEQDITLLKAALLAKSKTKKVFGESLPASSFAYVGDANKPDTWAMPIKFGSDDKSKRFIRAAIVRGDSILAPITLTTEQRGKVDASVTAAAKSFGIDPAAEKAKLANIQSFLRKSARVYFNKTRMTKADLGPVLSYLDNDLGRLTKGLYDVSSLARVITDLGYVMYCNVSEQAYEGDEDSPLPDMLAANVNALLDSLLAMVQEEAEEMRESTSSLIAEEAAAAA